MMCVLLKKRHHSSTDRARENLQLLFRRHKLKVSLEECIQEIQCIYTPFVYITRIHGNRFFGRAGRDRVRDRVNRPDLTIFGRNFKKIYYF